MTELALIVGFTALMALCVLEASVIEEEDVPDTPLWMDYVSGPYVRTKRTVLKGRDR